MVTGPPRSATAAAWIAPTSAILPAAVYPAPAVTICPAGAADITRAG
jgi:hypothetical protein